jgi:TolB-like protein
VPDCRTSLIAIATLLPLLSFSTAAQQSSPPPTSGLEYGVAIVPLINITGQPEDEWIGSGIAETLAADLQSDPLFTVIGRESVRNAIAELSRMAEPDAGGDANTELLELGRRLGVRWVISGGYQRSVNQLRITAHMVEVATGTVVRSAKVDGDMADLFDLQDQVSGQLVAPPATEPDPEPPARPAPRVPPADPEPPPRSAPQPPPLPLPDTPRPDDVPVGRPGSPAGDAGVAQAGDHQLSHIDGPPSPIPPEVMNRDELGRTTVRAIRLTEGILLDGELDEEVYASVLPITGFIQQLPVEGAPATEKTEAWIMFDDRNVYVGARLHDSAPESEWVANEMRRDTDQLRQNDTFTAFFDTFYDRRNGFNFYTNPLGARSDAQFTNEGNPNNDWNPVWDVRVGRFDGGWTVEMEIPFKTLRYRSGSPQLWGIQLRRAIRRKNEWVYLTRLPISAGGGSGAAGIFRISAAATLTGMVPPPSTPTLEIKPYVIGGVTTDVNAGTENKSDGDFGLDAKYGITQNLTADLTYNPDFAQVEVDEQQVNLTRFSLFFPEKREFFLEGRGIFGFARGGVGGAFRRRAGLSGGGSSRFDSGVVPTLFYSRRIGLEGSTIVPIYGGGRVTGKMGEFDVGALSIQTEDSLEAGTDSTNFTVLRVKRDILRRSSVGGIFTNRSVSLEGPGGSQAYGVDATFAFFDNVSVLGYYAKTQTPDNTGEDNSYQGKFEYGGDRYGLTTDYLVVEDNFIPEVGFLMRDNFKRTNVNARFSPRPQSLGVVRQFTFLGDIDYYVTADQGYLETRTRSFDFRSEFENSDSLDVTLANNFERLAAPFPIGGVVLPAREYSFTNTTIGYTLGAQRYASGSVAYTTGAFWSGDIQTLAFSQGRVNVLDQFSIEPFVSLNWVDLPEGEFNTTLVSSRFNYAFTPRMFFGGLVQYNSSDDVLSANLRLRWEYSPGSELFVVYTEERDTDTLMPTRYSELRNRGFVIKFNRLFRM